MRTFFLTEGPALTDQQFTQSAIDAPMSALTTAGYAARSAIEQTLLGTVARVAKVPAPAKKNVMTSRFSSAEVVDSPDVVAARGDKLYSTAEEYKASPYYREAVPFETGMTESRARALAEINDERAIRDFYASKRPVWGLVGGVVGSGIAPENLIPVLGEYSGAATTSRMGKIAWTALRGGADAALNSAAFQTLTAPTRAQFGDDVSWQAIGENAAFAAAAGTVIGGLRGGYKALRGRYSGSKLASDLNRRSAPNPTSAPPPDAAMGTPQAGDIQPNGPAPDTFLYTLNGSGEPTGRMEPVWSVAPPDPINGLLDRVETPAARARAAVVMNDAVSGLALDGEVRLGEQARDSIGQLRNSLERVVDEAPASAQTVPVPERVFAKKPLTINGNDISPDIGSMSLSKAAMIARDWARARFANKLFVNQEDGASIVVSWQGLKHSASGNPTEAAVAAFGKIDQILETGAHSGPFPDKMGRPNIKGIHYYDASVSLNGQVSVIRAVVRETLDGKKFYDHFEIPSKDAPIPGGEPGPATTIQVTTGAPSLPAPTDIASEGPIAKTATSFAVPAPEPMLPQLTAAYKATDELPKVVSSMDADMRREVLRAKAEGLDLETGTHDLETDMTILKELGSLTPEEEAALAAADDTFTAAEAWEEVTSNLITCRATSA